MEGTPVHLDRPSAVAEKALHLPEVLACILSWLSNDGRTLRSVRLVSKQFHATANHFFRIHLNAEYAMRHNCVQEAASIIGGLTVTFKDHSVQSLDDFFDVPEVLELPQERLVDTAFCSLVARTCIHLERLAIILEGSYSEEVPLLFSALLSQNQGKAAVFRIKELEVAVRSNFQQSISSFLLMQSLESTASIPWATPKYSLTESSFARLETITLQRSYPSSNEDIYMALQFKICPEVAMATSFLGPAFFSSPKKGAALIESLKKVVQPSRTFKSLECHALGLSVDQIFKLKEMAPALEELRIWEIFNLDETTSANEVFARESARQPGSLSLKQLKLMTCTGRYAKLLLCRLLNPTILESFYVDYLYLSIPIQPNHVHEDSNTILKEIMEEMRQGTLSGWPQFGSLREFGIRKMDELMNIDWLQELRTTPRFSRLEKISLPISVHQFVEVFDNPLVTDFLAPPSHGHTSADTTLKVSAGSREQLVAQPPPLPPLPQLPFPACSSLLSFTLNSNDPQTNEASDGPRFANYLTRWILQLEHLDIHDSSFVDFSFLDIIAPSPRPSTSSLVSISSQTDDQLNDNEFERCQYHSKDSNGSNDNTGIGRGSLGLCRLKSLTASFEFLSQDEFLSLPRSNRLLELLDRKSQLSTLTLANPQGELVLYQYRRVDRHIRSEEHNMLLYARPIQVHEDRVDQLLAILGRFQNSRPWIKGLKKVSFSQVGMPKIFLKKLDRQVKLLYPEVEWKSISHLRRVPGSREGR